MPKLVILRRMVSAYEARHPETAACLTPYKHAAPHMSYCPEIDRCWAIRYEHTLISIKR